MRAVILLLVSAVCLVSVGCSSGPVEEVKAFIEEKDDVILQIGKQIEASPNEAGVDEARKIFEARKGGLKAKRDVVRQKDLGPYSNLLSMLSESAQRDTQMFEALSQKLPPEYEVRQKLARIERDFKEVVK